MGQVKPEDVLKMKALSSFETLETTRPKADRTSHPTKQKSSETTLWQNFKSLNTGRFYFLQEAITQILFM